MGRHHVRVYSEMPEVKLVGVADVDASRQELADTFKAPFFHDYQEMLSNHAIDAVSIAVPTRLRQPITTFVLRQGIHALVEKPIAHTPAEADELIDLAKKHDRIFAVGHVERYNPVVLRLYELIKAGTLGHVLSVVCKRVGGFPTIEPQTDVIVDLAVHDIDIISSLLGHTPRIIGSHISRTFHSRRPDAAEILLEVGGASGFIQANWVTPVKIRTISVTGTKGYVEANYITQDITVYEHSELPDAARFDDFVKQLGNPKTHTEHIEKSEPLRVELETFVAAILSGDTRTIVNPYEAKLALVIALEATKGQHE
jgi:UDP-N-acetylglucosamine 3-dehydrogenase